MTEPALSPAAEAALALIRRQRTGTSFVEIVAAIDAAGIPAEGDHALCNSGDPNIVLWPGISEEVVDAVTQLLHSGLAHLHPTDQLVYIADGAVPNMPVVSRPPVAGYKTPHWLPAVVNAGPAPDKTRRSAGRRR